MNDATNGVNVLYELELEIYRVRVGVRVAFFSCQWSSSKHHSLALTIYWAFWVAEYRVPFRGRVRGWARTSYQNIHSYGWVTNPGSGVCKPTPTIEMFILIHLISFKHAFIAVLSSVQSTHKPTYKLAVHIQQTSFLGWVSFNQRMFTNNK